MAGERADSGADLDLWTEEPEHDLHNITPEDDDDVFELSSPRNDHDDHDDQQQQQQKQPRRPRVDPLPKPYRKKSVYEMEGAAEARGSSSSSSSSSSGNSSNSSSSTPLAAISTSGLWSMSGRRFSGPGSSPSILHRLHPGFTFPSIVSPIQLSQPAAPEASPTPAPAHPTPSPCPATGEGPREAPAGRAGAPCLRLTQFPSSPPSPAEDTGGLVTLHSLGSWRDSGYVPSPSSAHSFTFSSDEDEPKWSQQAGQAGVGVTPPIAIPHSRRRPAHHQAIREEATEGEKEEKQEAPEDWTPVLRGRTRSCPDTMRPPGPLRAPVPRFPPTLTPKPSHGRNWSTPATTPDGQPILMPTPAFTPTPLEARAASSRSSRDALIDLTEEDGGGVGHRRRVLVLALPDLVADTEGRASGSCTPPSSAHSPTEAKGSRVSFSHAVSNATGGATRIHSRPAWSRPRALSCDVTLEVELGQELRRIGDTFHRAHAMAMNEEASVWSRLRRSFRSSGSRSTLTTS